MVAVGDEFQVLLALDLDLLVVGRVGQIDDIGGRRLVARDSSYRVPLVGQMLVVVVERCDRVVELAVAAEH